MNGEITFYNKGKGYGFITCGVTQIFFHASNFQLGCQPVVGRPVEFEMAPGLPGKKAMAVNLRYTDVKENPVVTLSGVSTPQKEDGKAGA